MKTDYTKISKFLSLVLRHQPEAIALTLDGGGWADVDELIARANERGWKLDRSILETVVATNDKQRFTFNATRTKIRANQGHSIAIDLGLTPRTPPELLFHGTATRFLESIKSRGLLAGDRQYVHLSADETTALRVGERHGKPVVLRIRAEQMSRRGNEFYLSDNGVWLVRSVPVAFLDFPPE